MHLVGFQDVLAIVTYGLAILVLSVVADRKNRNPLAVTMQLEEHSALTPALSLREREKLSPVFRPLNGDFFQRGQMVPPLPGGEGWGEGEPLLSLHRYGLAWSLIGGLFFPCSLIYLACLPRLCPKCKGECKGRTCPICDTVPERVVHPQATHPALNAA